MSDQQQVVQLEDIYGDLEFGMSLETDNTQDPVLWGQAPAAAPSAAPGPAQEEAPLVKVDAAVAEEALAGLYDDLYTESGEAGATLLRSQLAELQDRVQQQEGVIEQLQQQVEELGQQNKELLHAKSVLCTNISSLYTTAKLEIQRKSDEIQELRDKLARATSGRPPQGPRNAPSQPTVGREGGSGTDQVQQQQQGAPQVEGRLGRDEKRSSGKEFEGGSRDREREGGSRDKERERGSRDRGREGASRDRERERGLERQGSDSGHQHRRELERQGSRGAERRRDAEQRPGEGRR